MQPAAGHSLKCLKLRLKSIVKMSPTKCSSGPTNCFTLGTPVGPFTLTTCPRGIHQLDLPEVGPDFSVSDEREPVRIIDQEYKDNGYTYKPALQCVEWLNLYFSGSSNIKSEPSPPICSLSLPVNEGTFRKRVWETLAEKVKFGMRVSYRELAEMSGSPKAQQAVGTAMRSNPISIIVPCHRVILSSGELGNYGGGKRNQLKVWLLEHEERVNRKR